MKFRKTLAYLLWPLTMWYAIGVAVRNFMFTLGLKKQQAPHLTTIGIGNLTTGGSGKTPHAEYLLDLLAPHHRVALLSRGYKRSSKGFVLDDGTHSPTLLGDEPAMVAAKHPDVQVAVCEKRVVGVNHLMEQEEPPEVVLLDDVFQHRYIHPTINILLTDYHHPYYTDHILPFGNLREFKSAAHRATIVVVTKCPSRLNPVEKHNIANQLKLANYQKLFFSYIDYGQLVPIGGGEPMELRSTTHALVVTGIAHAQPLVQMLQRQCKVHHLPFADHHRYTSRDIARITVAFEGIQASHKIIITTEKDAVRLQGLTASLPVYVQPIKVRFHDEGTEQFDETIRSLVRENISFLSKFAIWQGRDK